MKNVVRSLALFALLVSNSLQAKEQDLILGLKMSGLVAMPVADGDVSSVRGTIEPSLKLKMADIEVAGRVRGRSLKFNDERRDIDIRELTMAWRNHGATFTIGAQQLNWGRMDLLRVIDIINPVDQHDLFFEDLPESKLALWLANLELHDNSRTLQVVLTPQVPVDRLNNRISNLSVNTERPKNSIKNSTIAARYAFDALGWNADILASSGWQPTPTLRLATNSQGPYLQGILFRQTSVGFSADKPFGGTVLRIEGLAARLKPHKVDNSSNVDDRRQLTLGAGLDTRFGEWIVAGQIVSQSMRDTAAGKSHRNYVSLIVQRKWLNDRLASRAIQIREKVGSSSWSSLQMSYELSPNQQLQLQADRFSGEATQPFGSFTNRSRLALSIKITL